jgi:hypothetical protein
MRGYRKTALNRKERSAFNQGVATFRSAAVELFRSLGNQQMHAATVANMLQMLDPTRPNRWSTEPDVPRETPLA